MKKVCIIITKLELGGSQKVATYIAEHLNKNEFDSFIISGPGGLLDEEVSRRTKLIHISCLVREISPIKDFRALIEIYKILKDQKPDIVHTHSSKAGILGRIAAKMAGVKTIFHTIHGYGFNERQKIYVKYLYIYLERFCSMITKKLICVANEDIRKGLEYHIAKRDKFITIRAGVHINFYKNYKPQKQTRDAFIYDQNTKIISTIGPFKPQKNLADFIRAAKIISDNVSNIRFLMIGDGQQRSQLEGLIDELGVKDKILLLGWRNDVCEILCSSDIFVLTSLWEGLPCTVVEAMCCKKAVIANAVDGVKEIVKDNETGFLIKPLDYPETAKKAIYLLNNDDINLKFGERAQASIGDEFDIDFVVSQHEKLYNGE
jgi:glycosyltransferase involved in cell wall biosynthesis